MLGGKLFFHKSTFKRCIEKIDVSSFVQLPNVLTDGFMSCFSCFFYVVCSSFLLVFCLYCSG